MYNRGMRNNNAKGNTMTIDFEHGLTENVAVEDAHNTTWSQCECYACTSGDEDFENNAGDGPSGFDYYQDTKWSC